MNIVTAAIDDLPEIARLYQELNASMAALHTKDFIPAQQDEGFIRSVLEGADGDVLIARDGAAILGFALVFFKSTPPYPAFRPRKFAYLMDIVVDSNHRHKGIGGELLKAVEAWAREREAEFVELGVLSDNLPAIRAYEKAGYREDRKTMRLELH